MREPPSPSCQAPTLESTVHHVSVPGSVADTHRANKIDIKNHTFINNGETLQSLYYIVWAINLIIYIRVLIQRSYNVVVPFLQSIWSADVNLFLNSILYLYPSGPRIAPLRNCTSSSSYVLLSSHPSVASIAPSSYVLLQLNS
jgi:hypothetical protein